VERKVGPWDRRSTEFNRATISWAEELPIEPNHGVGVLHKHRFLQSNHNHFQRILEQPRDLNAVVRGERPQKFSMKRHTFLLKGYRVRLSLFGDHEYTSRDKEGERNGSDALKTKIVGLRHHSFLNATSGSTVVARRAGA
jgi:hypothetical protein